MIKLVLKIEVEKLDRKQGILDYTHEAAVIKNGRKSYFYGHCVEEVLAKVLANLLENKP